MNKFGGGKKSGMFATAHKAMFSNNDPNCVSATASATYEGNKERESSYSNIGDKKYSTGQLFNTFKQGKQNHSFSQSAKSKKNVSHSTVRHMPIVAQEPNFDAIYGQNQTRSQMI